MEEGGLPGGRRPGQGAVPFALIDAGVRAGDEIHGVHLLPGGMKVVFAVLLKI